MGIIGAATGRLVGFCVVCLGWQYWGDEPGALLKSDVLFDEQGDIGGKILCNQK